MCTLEAQENEVLRRTNLKKVTVFQPDPPCEFFCFLFLLQTQYLQYNMKHNLH